MRLENNVLQLPWWTVVLLHFHSWLFLEEVVWYRATSSGEIIYFLCRSSCVVRIMESRTGKIQVKWVRCVVSCYSSCRVAIVWHWQMANNVVLMVKITLYFGVLVAPTLRLDTHEHTLKLEERIPNSGSEAFRGAHECNIRLHRSRNHHNTNI